MVGSCSLALSHVNSFIIACEGDNLLCGPNLCKFLSLSSKAASLLAISYQHETQSTKMLQIFLTSSRRRNSSFSGMPGGCVCSDNKHTMI